MSFNPAFQRISGDGKPVLIVIKNDTFWTSFGTTTFTGGVAPSVQEALGSTVNILSTDDTADSIVTAASHGFLAGYRILVAGHSGTTPDINGEQDVVQVLAADEFKIDVNITAAGGASGTVRRTPDYRGVRAGQRVSSFKLNGSLQEPVWARIMDVDNTNKIIYLDPRIGTDGWVGGLPANGQQITVDGWVIDLPYCYSLGEAFTPEQLEHKLHRGRKESQNYGYRYEASLDYAQWIAADTLYAMADALNLGLNDKLILIPRIDKPGFSYNVKWKNAPQSISRFGRSPGHKGLVFRFEATELVDWPLANSGWGFNWAANWGNDTF